MKHNIEFTKALLDRFPRASVLSISFTVPDFLYEHEGDVAVASSKAPIRPFRSRDAHLIIAANTADVRRSVANFKLCRGERPFDLIFVKHDHRMSSLRHQIDAALSVAGPRTLFVFEDAVPHKLSVAKSEPAPGESWYVGEVWMLKHLLKQQHESFFVRTTELLPTGIMIAGGFSPLARVDFDDEYRRLATEITTDEDLQALSVHAAPGEVFELAEKTLHDAASQSGWVLSAGLNTSDDLESRQIDGETTWRRSEPKFVLDLSGASLDTSRLYAERRRVHGKYIDTFENAFLVGSDTILKRTNVYCRNRDVTSRIMVQRARNFGTHDNHGTGFFLADEQVLIDRKRLEQAFRVEQPIMLGSPDEYRNWGMWLFLAVPSIVEFTEHRDNYAQLLCYDQLPWQQHLLAELGVAPADIISHDINEVYDCAQISVVRHSWRDLTVTPHDRMIYASLVERFASIATVPGHEKILVSRITRTQRHGAYRGLMNEQELVDRLVDLGFHVVEPEYLDFPQQVLTFAAARVVVGLGGAAMFNTIFCRPGAFIIDIESSMGFVDTHANIFASVGLDYGIILGKQDQSDDHPIQKRWTIDARAAVDQIKSVLVNLRLDGTVQL